MSTREVQTGVGLNPSGVELTWDPYRVRGSVDRLRLPDERLLDEIALLGRQWSDGDFQRKVLEIAARHGPLTFCDVCLIPHRLEWFMISPSQPRGDPPLDRESLVEWHRIAAHVNAIRRLISALAGDRAGAEEDWVTAWPPPRGWVEARVDLPWGDVSWERTLLAGHLDQWVSSCHAGLGLRWDGARPERVEHIGSLLGDIGVRMVYELLDGTRFLTCTATVRGQPCRVTKSVIRLRERSMPRMCDACWAAARQRKESSDD